MRAHYFRVSFALVEVRSKEEILVTLDANGRLEEMPFMPEMLNTVHFENIRCNG